VKDNIEQVKLTKKRGWKEKLKSEILVMLLAIIYFGWHSSRKERGALEIIP
jgi:hypothetical protein